MADDAAVPEILYVAGCVANPNHMEYDWMKKGEQFLILFFPLVIERRWD
jgi:hypothetical protein